MTDHKIKVGQSWQTKTAPHNKVTIVRLEKSYDDTFRMFADGGRGEFYFGNADRDCFSIALNLYWDLIQDEPLPDTKRSPENKEVDLSDWRVWRDSSILPGECVCKIPKERCRFHR